MRTAAARAEPFPLAQRRYGRKGRESRSQQLQRGEGARVARALTDQPRPDPSTTRDRSALVCRNAHIVRARRDRRRRIRLAEINPYPVRGGMVLDVDGLAM